MTTKIADNDELTPENRLRSAIKHLEKTLISVPDPWRAPIQLAQNGIEAAWDDLAQQGKISPRYRGSR